METKEGKEDYSTHPNFKLIDGPEIADDKGELIFNSHEFIENHWKNHQFVIATPDIPSIMLGPLENDLRRIADIENHDLSALIYGSIEDEEEKVKDRWELGWDDGHYIAVHIFPKEFFDSQPDAREIFDQKIAPQLLSEYDESA